MPFDGIVTKGLTEELQQFLTGGRLSRIHQPTQNELIFTVRNNRENFSLLLSIHPSYARMHITEQSFPNPDTPPMFCMVLRKHLQGAIIKKIEQHDLERIVFFECLARDDIGDHIPVTLVIELMGRHSNIILLNENKEHIIGCIKHVPPSQNRYRTLLPGARYKMPPPQNKLNILTTHGTDFIKRLDFNAGRLDRQTVQTLTGFSPTLAKQLIHDAHLGSEADYMKAYEKMKEQIALKQYKPTIYREDKEDFHIVNLTYLQNEKNTFSSINEMLDAFYANKADRDRIKQLASGVYRTVRNELNKTERRKKIHEKTMNQAKRADHYQKMGELLTAHMHEVKQGDSSITVIDYYDPAQGKIDIPLQQDKTPSENAQIFFNRYRKLSTARVKARQELFRAKVEIEYLESVLQQLDQARDEDFEEIREELQREGYIKKQKQRRRRKRRQPKPDQFTSTDGTTIYVGRNNAQNEYVTHRLAHRDDIWLHTLDIPGSHVVIKSHDPSEETLHEAAQLAAYFSKASQSASVPVDYTRIKYVRKPSGAKPGFVTYTEQQTLFVTPDEKVIQALSK